MSKITYNSQKRTVESTVPKIYSISKVYPIKVQLIINISKIRQQKQERLVEERIIRRCFSISLETKTFKKEIAIIEEIIKNNSFDKKYKLVNTKYK